MRSILRVSTAAESIRSTGIHRESLNFASDESTSVVKRISFNDVSIREYGLTVGDNPSCSSGPPLSLTWEYIETHSTNLEVYERIRGPRRDLYDLIMDRDDRQEMLVEDWNVTRVEIAHAVRENFKVKNQRRRSVHNSKKTQKMDLFLESARRKLKRTLLFQKKTSVRVEDMMQQATRAAAHMAEIMATNQLDNELGEGDKLADRSKLSNAETYPWDDGGGGEGGTVEEPVYEDGRHNYMAASSA